jgi:predicted transcriptional regulator
MAEQWLDDLFSPAGGSDFIDTDTYRTEQGDVRFKGIDAPEQSKIVDGVLELGDVGGLETSRVAAALAKKHGFTENIITDEKDPHGRFYGDKVNPNTGELLSDKYLESGLANTAVYSTPQQVETALLGRLERYDRKSKGIQNDWDIAVESLNRYKQMMKPGITQKPVATTEMEYMSAPDYYMPYSIGVGSEGWERVAPKGTLHDRYRAKSSLLTGLAVGSGTIKEGLWSAWDLVGDAFDVKNGGEEEVARVQREISVLPILENQSAFDEHGNWRLDSAYQVLDFIVTNAAISAPYMLQTAVATALASPTMGASLAVPSLTYIGQTYNEQDPNNKSIGSAVISGIMQGALEQIGFNKLIAAKGPLSDPTFRKKIVQEVADAKYKGNTDIAERAIANASMRELKKVSTEIKNYLADQYKGKYVSAIKAGGKAALADGAVEAATETGQEFLAMLGAKNFDMSKIDMEEAQNRLLNAMVAGGTLGGIIGGGRGAISDYKVSALGDFDSDADLTRASNDYKNQEERKMAGLPTNMEDVLVNNSESSEVFDSKRKEEDKKELSGNLNDIAKPEEDKRKKEGFVGTLKEIWNKGVGGLHKGMFRELSDRFQGKGPETNAIFSMAGGNKTLSGASAEEYQQLREAELLSIIDHEDNVVVDFNVASAKDVSNIMLDSEVVKLVERVSEAYSDGTAKDGHVSWRAAYNALVDNGSIKFPEKFADKRDAILSMGEKIDRFDAAVAKLTGRKKVSGLSKKTFNKGAIAAKRDGFIAALIANGFKQSEAEALYASILDKEFINATEDIQDSFLNVDMSNIARLNPSDLQALNSEANMQEFFNSDLFYNASAIAGSVVAADTNRKYFGKDGSVIANQIKRAFDAGEIDADEAAYIAAEFRDYLKMRAGEYKVIQSPTWRAFQQNALFLTVLNQLPLAAVSSLVEVGLVDRGVIIKNRADLFADHVRMAGNEFKHYLNGAVNASTRGKVQRKGLTEDQQNLFELGYLHGDMAAAQKHDIKLAEGSRQGWRDSVIRSFFKYTGLTSVTNFTRSARLALAGDAILGYIEDASAMSDSGVLTKQGLEAREAMIALGMDVDFFIDQYNKRDAGPVDEPTADKMGFQLKLAAMNFVNEAVAHPTKANRPKFYNNPRTAIFFQFQGFLSSFTSTILPKLYRQTFGANSPASSKLDAYGTIMTLLAIAFLSQYLKDLIKYGEETPYLDGTGLVKRTLYSSGLTGTGERLLTQIPGMELYPSRGSKNILEWIGDRFTEQAPTISYGVRVADAVTEAVTGGDKVAYKVGRASPYVGPLTQPLKDFNETIYDLFE